MVEILIAINHLSLLPTHKRYPELKKLQSLRPLDRIQSNRSTFSHFFHPTSSLCSDVTNISHPLKNVTSLNFNPWTRLCHIFAFISLLYASGCHSMITSSLWGSSYTHSLHLHWKEAIRRGSQVNVYIQLELSVQFTWICIKYVSLCYFPIERWWLMRRYEHTYNIHTPSGSCMNGSRATKRKFLKGRSHH